LTRRSNRIEIVAQAPRAYGSVVDVDVVAGQVVVEPWHRHGSGSPKHPTPISKQLNPRIPRVASGGMACQ
jgi:hypothetical protein